MIPTSFSATPANLYQRGCLGRQLGGFPWVPCPAVNLLTVPVWWEILNEVLQLPAIIFRERKHIKSDQVSSFWGEYIVPNSFKIYDCCFSHPFCVRVSWSNHTTFKSRLNKMG